MPSKINYKGLYYDPWVGGVRLIVRYCFLTPLYSFQAVLILGMISMMWILALSFSNSMMTSSAEAVVTEVESYKPVYADSTVGRIKRYFAKFTGFNANLSDGVNLTTNEAQVDAVRYRSIVTWRLPDGTTQKEVLNFLNNEKVLPVGFKLTMHYNPSFPSLARRDSLVRGDRSLEKPLPGGVPPHKAQFFYVAMAIVSGLFYGVRKIIHKVNKMLDYGAVPMFYTGPK